MKAPDLWGALPLPAFVLDGQDVIEAANPAAEGFLNRSARALSGCHIRSCLTMEAPLEEGLGRVRRTGAPLFINDVGTPGTDGLGDRGCTIQISPYGEGPKRDGRLLLLVSPQETSGPLAHGRPARKAAKSAIGMAEMLAHEIKNPLAGITGAAQLLAMNLAGNDRELTDLIVSECRRIVLLLERVEQFGNLSPPQCRPVNLHDALDRARRSAALGQAAGMTFREDFDPSLPSTWADPDQLQQVFLNLITNAAQAAGKDGGTITLRSYYDQALRLRDHGGKGRALPLQVEIIDDGPGLPPEIADEIFEPFVSGRENGTGLGLALVSKIITDHGGLIGVRSRPGRTVFRISLPQAPPLPDGDADGG